LDGAGAEFERLPLSARFAKMLQMGKDQVPVSRGSNPTQPIVCPACGHKNVTPLNQGRCTSCGARIEAIADSLVPELEGRGRREGFNYQWLGIAFVITAVLTAAIVMGLPMVIQLLDFEGSAGMVISIPVWFLAGLLVGLISPSKVFVEPAVATVLVAVPTVMFLIRSQTVKTMPVFMYVLLAALGVLFSMIGSYTGERIQMGPTVKPRD
jgi:hypothetical protein